MRVEILLSTYNGEKYLPAQLDSLLHQAHPDYHITVHDDGSGDATPSILRAFSAEHPGLLTFLEDGKSLRYPDCYWYLLENAPDADLYAFCDQDDVWDSGKLAACCEMCGRENPETPLLWFHDYRISDGDLKVYAEYHASAMGFRTDYPYNMIYFVMTSGFAMVINHSLRRRILWDTLAGKNIPHDRWILWCAFFAGKILYDPRLLVTYRRHGNTVTPTGKGNGILLKEWWREEVRGNRMAWWNGLARYYAECYSKEMDTRFPDVRSKWLLISGNRKGFVPYLKRLFFPLRLKPSLVGELILRFCFLLNK